MTQDIVMQQNTN